MGFVFCAFTSINATLTQKCLLFIIFSLLILVLSPKGVQNYCLFIDFQKVSYKNYFIKFIRSLIKIKNKI
jgi:uncharacterized membrane protein (UPF0182 family)